jgi:O-antigen/teichoic acid export membrane protein
MPAGDGHFLRSLLRSVPAAVRRDYVASLAVQWFVLGTGLVLFHLVARRGSVGGFAYYQIARGTVSTSQPALMLGLGLGLQRYLPRTDRGTRRLARHALLAEGAVVIGVGAAGVAAAPWIADRLGLPGGRTAVAAILVMLGGVCLCTIAIAGLRGNHQVATANVAHGLGLGLMPLVAFVAAERIEDFLIIQGAGAAVVGVCGTLAVRPRPGPPTQNPEPDLKTLIWYGVRRMPGELALPALSTFPTFAVAVAVPGGPEAGYVGFTTSAVTLICASFGMLTPVLLPRLSRLFHVTGESPDVRRQLTALPLIAGALAAIPAAAIFGFAPALVHTFLGAEFSAAAGVLRLGVPAAIPLAVFYGARPALEALLEAKALSRLLLVCLALEVALTGLTSLFVAAPYAAMLGLTGATIALGADGVVRAAYAVRRPRS